MSARARGWVSLGIVLLAASTAGCPLVGDPSGGRPEQQPSSVGVAPLAGSGGAPEFPGAGTSGAPVAGVGVAGAGVEAAGATAGAGGVAGQVSGGGSVGGAGIAGAAGASGVGGAAGSGGAAVDPVTGLTAAECVGALMGAGMTITACEMCLCEPGNCQPQIDAMTGDTAAAAMVACVQENLCTEQCCLCNAPCDPLGSNYAMGPCAAEIEAAAGVTPGAGVLVNAPVVQMVCAPTGPADNGCARAARLGECIASRCGAMCPSTAVCM